MAQLKDMYSSAFYDAFTDFLNDNLKKFQKEKFLELIFTDDWDKLELKERMHRSAEAIHHFMPEHFSDAAPILTNMVLKLIKKPLPIKTTGFEFILFSDYIESYGLEDYQSSVSCIEITTQLASCEFAVRPFILKYGEKMIKQMQQWSQHEISHVRRLSTEGMRPRLPWAISLPQFKVDPSAILPILENLKNDSSESVRKSVANNLNDISKDNPQIVLEIAAKWINNNPLTDAIIKHGCRSLLKQAHPDIMALYSLDSTNIVFKDFKINSKQIPIGERFDFSFNVGNRSSEPLSVRLEYAIYYQRQKGIFNKKVFKISEKNMNPLETVQIKRSHSFKEITTRKYYKGTQYLSIIINGKEFVKIDFELL